MRVEIRGLGSALLPRIKKGEVVNLTPRLSLRALSYRILSHAEIESYLEDMAIEIALAADKAWKERRHVSTTTLCLLAFSGQSLPRLPASLRAPQNRKQADWPDLIRPDGRLSRAVSIYMRRAKLENHGIKEENLLGLLLPIGFDCDRIDELLLAELNDFGTKRGRAAHVSVSGHVTAGVNPFDEEGQVKRILAGLKQVDKDLCDILRSAL